MATPPLPPMKLKQSPSASAASSSQEAAARLLVRETMRISAGLATSSPVDVAAVAASQQVQVKSIVDDVKFGSLVDDGGGLLVDSKLRLICREEIDGRRWNYVAEKDATGRSFKKNTIRAVSLQSPLAPAEVAFFFSDSDN